MPDVADDAVEEVNAPAAGDISVLNRPPAREQSAAFKLAVFGAVLIVVLFAGYGIGRLNESTPTASGGPVAQPAGDGHGHGAPAPAPSHDDAGQAPHVHNADGSVTPGGATGGGGAEVGGLSLTSAGLTLAPTAATFTAGRQQTFSFVVRGAGNAPVTTFAVVHDKPLHLIVIRRDLSGFQHVHPTMAADGTWSIPLTLAQPGSYRAVADFTAIVGGQQVPVTLGADLTVPGDYRPVPLPAPVQQATTGEFQVAYEGRPQIGVTQPLFMAVTSAGRPATLEPYLGAFGHLVVMREGDLGYVHVHPEATLVDGKVKFWLAAPGPGRYRMFFDFQVAGKVHTASWTAVVS
ncbi:hypothetical protein [Actinoplanes sp. NBRC 103695]|uniref:hypothetical protein n=1 Tax=Actinoplanes sp. NBRC 103695 TaxID=3032202 RepID=UPI0024A39CCB|nr:hypothetical protein [Actinoplanes sp. NBRC 103695]GLY96228.1 hypothetical protein Acsp02_34830 [Actinoplanes sp. NBRC 103695]